MKRIGYNIEELVPINHPSVLDYTIRLIKEAGKEFDKVKNPPNLADYSHNIRTIS